MLQTYQTLYKALLTILAYCGGIRKVFSAFGLLQNSDFDYTIPQLMHYALLKYLSNLLYIQTNPGLRLYFGFNDMACNCFTDTGNVGEPIKHHESSEQGALSGSRWFFFRGLSFILVGFEEEEHSQCMGYIEVRRHLFLCVI